MNIYDTNEFTSIVESTYIDSSSLSQCLDIYFNASLDYVDDVALARLYRPLSEMYAGNSLMGQLDQDTMRSCLELLSVTDQLALENVHKEDKDADKYYCDALFALSREVMKVI